MSDDEAANARRRYAINEVLIRLMAERIKAGCGKMMDAGATAEQVNARLPDVIEYYDRWREETLSRLMREFDDLERPWPVDPSPLKPLTTN